MSMNGLLPSISVLGTKEDGLTLTVLGCGTMGIAILSGVLASLSQPTLQPGTQTPSTSGTSTPVRELPSRLPTKFIACVRRPESAKRIKKALLPLPSNVTILQNENLKGAEEADIVLLGCKPQMVQDVLGTDEMRTALQGKMLISICAGVTEAHIESILHSNTDSSLNGPRKCRVMRAMPNTASILRESMTVISTPSPPPPAEMSDLVHWMFSSIGRTLSLPPSLMDASTALCGSGPAFFALVLESLADGAVAMGLPRAEAQLMAAQTMLGTAKLVLGGEHPALVREKVGTPGGCTIGGLLVLEEGRVRGTVARAVREATVVAAELGRGGVGVNGTRF